jgi:hypothetical protein
VKHRALEKFKTLVSSCRKHLRGIRLLVDAWNVGHVVVKRKLRNALLFLLFIEEKPVHKLKENLGCLDILFVWISPMLLAWLGLEVFSAYGLLGTIAYIVFCDVALLEIFHIAFDR